MPLPLWRKGEERRAAVLLTGLILVGCGVLSAQQSIIGKVKGASTGAPVAEAEVHIVDEATRTDHVTTSGKSGRFSVLDLPPGTFEVTIRKEGYLSERSQVSLTPRRVLTLEVILQPATADRETVVVGGQVDLFDTQRAQTSVVMSRVDLEQIPDFQQTDIPKLVSRTVPGAIEGHDNFIHLKGNELSLHQFVDGVAFLDNPHAHFTPGFTPQMIESVNVITGGMPAEFGNRVGGILDIVTKSGRNIGGGSVTLGAGTIVGRDAAFEYGIGHDKWDVYFLGSGFSDGRFLNPPQKREIHDLGYGSRSLLKLGFVPGDKDRLSLLVSGGGVNFELPNTTEEHLLGRDPLRRTRETSAVLRWQRTLSADALLTTSAYNRYVSDRLVGTSDPLTPFGQGFRRTATTGAKVDLLYYAAGHTLKAGVDATVISLNEDLVFDPREEADKGAEEEHREKGLMVATAFVRPKALLPGTSPVFSEAALPPIQFRSRRRGGQGSFYIQDRFSPFRNFTVQAGVRYDRYSIVLTEDLISPRIGLSYHIPTGTVIRVAYSRFFVPPPLEYVQLGSALGSGAFEEHEDEGAELGAFAALQAGPAFSGDEEEETEGEVFPGSIRAHTQHYFEFGVQQKLHQKIVLDVSGFHHQGRHAFENVELSNTRLFVPTNFDRERTWGADFSLRLRPLDKLGVFGFLNYNHTITNFFGPVSGGQPSAEVEGRAKITPAFDQRHTATSTIGYRHDRSGFVVGFATAFGSGTPAELAFNDEGEPVGVDPEAVLRKSSFLPVPFFSGDEGEGGEERLVRLPSHWTFDFWTGITVWEVESKSVDLRFSFENIGDRIFAIAKESEVSPIQFGARRRVSGQLRLRF